MQPDFLTNLTAWAIALLAYPGLLFAIVLALVGEWLAGILRPLFTPRLYRGRSRAGGFLDPLLVLFKMLARKDAVHWQAPEPAGNTSGHVESFILLAGALAPIMALSLMPVSANPLTRTLGIHTSLFLVLAILAIYPLASAAAQARGDNLSVLTGAQTAGALLTGLLPTLLLVAALVQVSGSTSLNMDELLAAPRTPEQTFVRLLSGIALLVALPWWLGRRPSRYETGSVGAGSRAGKLFQGVALAVFWTVLVLPSAADMTWSITILVGGALFAHIAMRLIGERWWPTRRTTEAANLVWLTTLPIAAAALLLSIL